MISSYFHRCWWEVGFKVTVAPLKVIFFLTDFWKLFIVFEFWYFIMMHLSMYFNKSSFGICWAQIPKNNLNLWLSLLRLVKFLAFIFSNLKPLPLLFSPFWWFSNQTKGYFHCLLHTYYLHFCFIPFFISFLCPVFWIIYSNSSCSSPVGYQLVISYIVSNHGQLHPWFISFFLQIKIKFILSSTFSFLYYQIEVINVWVWCVTFHISFCTRQIYIDI